MVMAERGDDIEINQTVTPDKAGVQNYGIQWIINIKLRFPASAGMTK
jgi:hypothetical protein